MKMTPELLDYLTRAADGDESECPPDVDEVWHACLAHHQEYEEFCRKSFGLLVEHVVNKPRECHARRLCLASMRQIDRL
jgi:hypothetical protein